MINQQELIKACIRQDRVAQKTLYDAYVGSMLGLCYRYTKSMEDAQDVLQEGFIKIYRNLHQFKGEGDVGAWIRRIMVNTALNFLKRNARYQEELAYRGADMHPVPQDNPEINLSVKELAVLIRQLPTGYQTIFNLHAVEGYTHVEIGQILGISESTSRSQYTRARALLIVWIRKFYSDQKLQSYVQ
jgi:RNA polymerase sigma factor (sigma-70 family)